MGLYQWRLIDGVWDPVFGGQTQQVLDSRVSATLQRWIRLPDAVLGAIAYLGDVIFVLAGSTRRWQCRPWLVMLFGLNVIPLVIVSGLLVVVQGAVVGSWCFLCLVTAALSLVLVGLACEEVWTCFLFLRGVWRATNTRRTLWNTFCGRPSPAAHAVAQRMTEGKS